MKHATLALFAAIVPHKTSRRNSPAFPDLLEDQSVDEIIDLNRSCATLPRLETREEYYLSCARKEINEHSLKVARIPARLEVDIGADSQGSSEKPLVRNWSGRNLLQFITTHPLLAPPRIEVFSCIDRQPSILSPRRRRTKNGHRKQVRVETAQIQAKVLMLGTDPLVRDNVRVLLRSMGYQCFVASTLKEALTLLRQVKPDAAILDPRQADSRPARLVAAFLGQVRDLRGRSIVLVGEERDLELIQVLDAYSVQRVRLDTLFQELWPSLDSLLGRVSSPRQVTRDARLVFDSFLELSLAGVRSLQPTPRQLLYESDILVADLSLEGQKDAQRIILTGQVSDAAKRKLQLQLADILILIQGGRAGLMGIVKTNEWGEFHFEFEPEPDITLEIKARENLWVSAGLPDLTA